MSAEFKLSTSPITPENADPERKALLEDAAANLGFIPNMYAAMVNSPGLLTTYLEGYAAFRVNSGFSPAEQEVVFLSISYVNQCDYCMAAHSVIADNMSNVPVEVTNAIRVGSEITDQKLGALSRFTQTMVESRGLPSKQAADAFFAAGYTERHILEIILAIGVKTLSNYSNHLFHTPVDDVFAARRWPDEG